MLNLKNGKLITDKHGREWILVESSRTVAANGNISRGERIQEWFELDEVLIIDGEEKFAGDFYKELRGEA